MIEPGAELVTHVCQRRGCLAQASFHRWPAGHWCLEHVPSDHEQERETLRERAERAEQRAEELAARLRRARELLTSSQREDS